MNIWVLFILGIYIAPVHSSVGEPEAKEYIVVMVIICNIFSFSHCIVL